MAADSNAAEDLNTWTPPSFDRGGEAEAGMPALVPSVPRKGFAPTVDEFDSDREGFAEGMRADPNRDPDAPDFASIKFQRENTLLTNAEKYAESIREEAELYVAQMRKEIDELNVQAEARYEEARLVKKEAEEQADTVVSDAEEKVEEIRAQAREEGNEEGRKEGLEKRYAEAGVYLERLEAILAEMAQFRKQVAYYAEKDSVRLAMLIARKVLRQELKINKQAVWQILAKTLASLNVTGEFKVWLSPDDFEFAQRARPSLEKFIGEGQSLTFRAKPELTPGNVLLETDREVVDMTFQAQFHYVEQALNQALAERETVVQNRPEPAAAPKKRSAPARRASSPAARSADDAAKPQAD